MRIQHPIAQAAALAFASLLIAVIANGFAGRTRQLKLPGWYPHALRVPPREQPAPTPIVPPSVTTTTTVATVTDATTTSQPAVVVPSTTIATATTAPQASTPAAQPQIAATVPLPTTAPSKADLSRFIPHPDKAYVEITGDDAAALFGAGVLFLDARRTSVFEDGHIAGARSYSVWESDIDDKVNALFEERSDPAEQNKPIVIYCSGGACEDSHTLAQKLWGIQFNNVYVYKDGFPDWQKRRLPTGAGAKP